VEERESRFVAAAEPVPVEQLGLERREEALGDGVIEGVAAAAPCSASRWHPASFFRKRARVLAAAIRVMHDSGCGLTLRERHPERVDDELERKSSRIDVLYAG
jgi:hypothetical protein